MPTGDSIRYSILLSNGTYIPVIISFVLACLFTYFAYRITSPQTSLFRRVSMAALRILAFTLIFLSILEPVLIKKGEKTIEPSVVIALDNSYSIANSEPDIALEKAQKAFDILSPKYDTRSYVFNDSLLNIDFHREKTFAFDGLSTRIGDILIATRNMAIDAKSSTRNLPKHIGAVVLISDGQNNAGDDPISIASKLDFPVYAYGVGKTTPPKNIAVKQIVANKLGYLDQPTKVYAYIEGWGTDEPVNIQFRKGNSILGEKTITTGKKGEQVEVEFEFTPNELGQAFYKISAPILEDETIIDDNTRSFSMNILPSKKKILIAHTSLNWDVTFFRRALETNQNYEIHTIDFNGKIKSDIPIPRDENELSEYDLVCLINFNMDSPWCRLFALYLENGGSILNFTQYNRIYCQQYHELSPFSVIPSNWADDEFSPIVTMEGKNHPIFDFTELEENALINDNWTSQLPPLKGFMMADKLRPGAQILMTHPALNEIPIMVGYERGKSRQLVINAGGFWRWSFVPFGFGNDNTMYNTIVLNSAQWLLAREDVSPFVLDSDKKVYRSGENILINAGLRDDAGNPFTGATIDLTFTRTYTDVSGSQKQETFSAIMEETGNGFYNLKIPSLDTGDYRITGEVLGETGLPLTEKSTSIRVEAYSSELADLRKNTTMLKSLAGLSGGKYLDDTNFDDTLNNLNLKSVVKSVRNEEPLWDKLLLLLIILVLLGCEWFLRKRANLP